MEANMPNIEKHIYIYIYMYIYILIYIIFIYLHIEFEFYKLATTSKRSESARGAPCQRRAHFSRRNGVFLVPPRSVLSHEAWRRGRHEHYELHE